MSKEIQAVTSNRRLIRFIALLAATSALIPAPARAQNLPTGGQVVAGNAGISSSGTGMTVTQTSDRAVIDWTGFSIGVDNNVIFAQPGASSATLNRVRGDAISTIAGSITSNGAVYLVNPNGIFIGETGAVNAGGGFVASSLDISNDDFMSKKHNFVGTGASASISNAGRITAGQGAYVALLGGAVSNSGTINVPLGRLGLGSGEQIALDINGGNFMQVAVPSALVTGGNTLVDNSGTIVVLGGSVQMKAAVLRDAVRNLVNMSGTISADSATGQAGSIELSASDNGRVSVSGALSASAAAGNGGSVTIEGRDIALGESAAIKATGASGGGTVLVGGGYQGEGDLAHAQTLDMASGAMIDVSATQDGKGGTAVLWSDVGDSNSVTDFKGVIRARGAGSGDGGLVETSGYLADVAGGFVNAGSDHGAGGTWLIDPSDTTITQAVANSYVTTLNTGTNVLNDVTGSITFADNVTLTKTAGGNATLTLRSTNGGGIFINKSTISSTVGALNLVLWTRYGNEASEGRISLSESTINTNGGHVWIGGGNSAGGTWNGLTVGVGTATSLSFNNPAIYLGKSSILTQGGNLSMSGVSHYSGSDTSGTKAFGVWVDTGSTISTAAGYLNIGGSVYGKYTDGAGIYIGQTSGSADGATTISTTTGNLTMTGYATDQTGSGTGFRHGINIKSGNTNSPVSISTVSGSIALDGNANSTSSAFTSDSTGLQFQGPNVGVTSRTGAITLTGRNVLENASTTIAGVRFAPTDAANSIRIGFDGTNSYSGDITINANSLLQLGTGFTNNGVISMRTSGKFVFQPIDASFTFLRAESAALTFGNLWNFGTGLTGFTWGKAGSNYDLNFVASGFSVAGPINLYGRNITFGSGMTATADSAGILVKASGTITSNNGLGFYTKNGNIVFWSNSGGSTTAGGIRIGDDNYFNSAGGSTSQLTGGGDIIFGGGSAGTDRPTGAASSDSGFGVSFGSASTGTTSTTIHSGGGAIGINGYTSTSSTTAPNGVSLNRGFTINAGDGAINITGYSAANGQAVELGGWGDNSAAYSIKGGSVSITGSGSALYGVGSVHQGGTITATGIGGITLNGSTTKSGASNYGVYTTNTGVNLISNTGPISITGTAVNGTTGISFLGKALSPTGDISLNSGTKSLTFQGTLGRDHSLVTTSTGNVRLTGDTVTLSGLSVFTGGKLTIEPFSTSFANAFTWPVGGLQVTSDMSGLTLGKAGNTANLTIASGTNIAGPISLYGGNIALNANLTSSLLGADILVKATGAITGGANLTFRTNNGNLTFWSNAAGGTSGGIVFGDGNNFNSANGATNQAAGGGNIIFGGGNNAGLVPTGAASSSTTAGVVFGSYNSDNTTTSFYSGGGNISLNGASTYTGSGAFGLVINRIAMLNAGNGSISLTGSATSNHGIEVGAYNSTGTINQLLAAGDITISGTTTSNLSSGIAIGQSGSKIQSTGGNIAITGSSATGSSGRGMTIDQANNLLMTSAGSISLTSTGGSNLRFAGGGKILSSSGAISLNSGTGTTDVQATIGRDGSLVTSSSSDVTVTANTVAVTSTAINTSGKLVVQPYSTSFSTSFVWPVSGLTLSSDVSGLTLGKNGNTAGMTIASATSIAGPISLYGGNIALNANLTSSLLGADILVKATGSITGGTNLTFRTNNGDLTFWSNAAGGTSGGIIFGDGNSFNSANGSTSQTTGGGNIIFGGGNNAGLVPTGAASSSTSAGIAFGSFSSASTTTSFYSGGGNISLNGTSSYNGSYAYGLVFNRILSMQAGAGAITLTGTSGYGQGIELGAYNGTGTLGQILASGDITISGTHTGTGQNGVMAGGTGMRIQTSGAGNINITGSTAVGSRGVSFESAGNVLISDAGAINITSTNGSNARASSGMKILSRSGAITLNAGTGTIDLDATMGRDGSLVTTSSSNVTLTANAISFTDKPISTTGVLTVQPFDASFTNPFFWPASGVTLSSDIGGLTLGKTGNTANITISTGVSTNGPINVYGGNIIVNAALSAGGGVINLNASGSGGISGSAAGTIGNFSALTLNTSNAAGSGTLAGNISGTGYITKSGAGRVILAGANTYSGNTNISAGTLQAGSASGFSSASLFSVASGSILDIGGFNAMTGALTGNGTVSNASASAATLTTGGLGTSTIFSGTIQNGTGQLGLTKTGSGTLTLSGANSYTGTTTVNAGTLSLTGSLNVGAATISSITAAGATYSGSGILTAGTLNHSGAGTLSLTGANMLNAIAASGTIGAFTLNNARSIALGSIASTGRIIVTATGASSDLTLSGGTAVSSNAAGDAVVLSAGRNFLNNAGASAVSTPNGRWLIYSAAPGGDVFGNLDSGNTAIWNSSYTGSAVSQSGNHYLFAAQPTLLIAPLAQFKAYGDDLTSGLSGAYTVSGLHSGVAGAFQGDSAATIVSGSPDIHSDGAAATANAGTYSFTIDIAGMTAANGYTVAADTTPRLTVNPRILSLVGGKIYDGTTGLGGAVTLGNLALGETLTYSGATANSAHVADNSVNYINAITLGNGTGLASNYALPTLDAAHAAVIITPASLTATAGITGPLSRSYDGTRGTAASVTGSVSGMIAGDNIVLDTSGIALGYDSAHVADASSISASGTLNFAIAGSASGSQMSDYSFTAPAIGSVAAVITPASLTATLGNMPASKVYDGTTSAPAGFIPDWIVAGAVTGDVVTLVSDAASYDSKDVAHASRVTVTELGIAGISGAAGSALSDYVLSTTLAEVAASITPAPLSISGFAASGKIYDGTTTVAVSNWGALTGLIGNETLALLHGNAAFASADAGAGKTVTATGYTVGDGLNGGLASNYQLSTASATTSATIDKALLTIIANNDAKFITTSDNSGYAGLSYTGFVNGETSAVLSGSADISRVNASEQNAGFYENALAVDTSGLSATNYRFATRNGNYTIVPSSQLLVRVANSSSVYGAAPDYTISSAQYFNGSSIVDLGAAVRNADGSYTLTDGAGGSATFTIGLANAVQSGAGLTTVGAYQLMATNVQAQNAANFSDMLNLVGALSVTPRAVSVDAAAGASKVYDGTTAMNNVTMSLAGVTSGDNVTVAGIGNFAGADAGGNLAYTISNLTLDGADAANYYVAAGSFSGNDGTITRRAITVTADDASRSYGAADPAFGYTIGGAGLVAGDVLTGSLATDATGLSSVGQYSINQGSLAASNNYAISYVAGELTITQRDVATWIGGTTGNWFDPANWADGAVPTLSNVGNVLIPIGVTVTFDTEGALAGVPTGPVNLNGLGQGGSLIMNDGALSVGPGGIALADLTQTGGVLESQGDVNLESFTQTGGSTSTAGDFSTTTGFTQTGSGTLNVGGDAAIDATSGNVVLGNLTIAGDLEVDSKDGTISQSEGTKIAVDGTGSYTAHKDGKPADVTLGNSGNDLGSTVSANGANIALVQDGPLTLGEAHATGDLDIKAGGKIDFGVTTVGGDLHAASEKGGITQSGPVSVTGASSLAAGSGDIRLGNSGNQFGGAVSMSGAGVTLTNNGPIILGNVDATGKLTVNAGNGKITQAPGTHRNAAGGTSIGGASAETGSLTPFVVPERLVTTASSTIEAEAEKGAMGAGSCDPAVASAIYRAGGALSSDAGGCSAQ